MFIRCVSQCKTVAETIHLEVASLQALGIENREVAAKARFIYKTKQISDVQSFLSHITAALTLWVTVW